MRLANAADQGHALVRLVVGHAVALGLQGLANQADEVRIAGRAIPVAQDKVGQGLLGRAQALVDIAGHGVQVDVPDPAETPHTPADGLRQRGVVGAPVALDALLHLGHAECAVVHRGGPTGLAELLPHQTQALQGLGAGVQRRGPGAVQHRGVDVVFLAVGIDVGARERRLDQGRAMLGPGLPQAVHQRVLAAAQLRQGQREPEIRRIGRAAVRGVAHQRQDLGLRRVHPHRGLRAGLQKIRQTGHQLILMLARWATAV